jgi:hypothetical protein
MKHASNRRLFDYWNASRRGATAPQRSDLDPRAMSGTLADTFFLACDLPKGPRFRLAGTRVCALFGTELRGRSFRGIWNAIDAPQLEELVLSATGERVGFVAGVSARTASGESADLELLLLPLYDGDRSDLHLIGALAPIGAPYWLGVCPVSELALCSFRHVGGDSRRQTPNRPRLTVHQGGRAG